MANDELPVTPRGDGLDEELEERIAGIEKQMGDIRRIVEDTSRSVAAMMHRETRPSAPQSPFNLSFTTVPLQFQIPMVVGGSAPVPVHSDGRTGGQGLSTATKSALLAMELPGQLQTMLKKGIHDLETALMEGNAELLTSSLDRISYAALHRHSRTESIVPAALVFMDILDVFYASEDAQQVDLPFPSKRSVRRAFLSWWYDAWLAHLGRDQIRSYIQSPFHIPLVEDRVRSTTRNQITVYHEDAKKKLIEKLRAEKEETEAEAEELRKQGRDAEADRKEGQLVGYDWAIDEIESSMSGN